MTLTEQPLTPDWTDGDLERLRQLVKTEESSAWEMGDELLRLLPIGARHVKTGVAAAIRTLAAEVDAEPRTLTMYRTVAHAWPDTTRVASATWEAHRGYMGPPATAEARAKTLASLPRNEHGRITLQAVKDMTKGAGRGGAGWHEMLGQVSDTLTKASKELARFEDATAGRELRDAIREKAANYARQADELAIRLRSIAGETAETPGVER